MTKQQRGRVNKEVRKLLENGDVGCAFTTYMKAADMGNVLPYFVLADEAGQATEPDTVVLLSVALPGATVLMVGDELQLPPTVRHRGAEYEGLAVPLFG